MRVGEVETFVSVDEYGRGVAGGSGGVGGPKLTLTI